MLQKRNNRATVRISDIASYGPPIKGIRIKNKFTPARSSFFRAPLSLRGRYKSWERAPCAYRRGRTSDRALSAGWKPISLSVFDGLRNASRAKIYRGSERCRGAWAIARNCCLTIVHAGSRIAAELTQEQSVN